MLSISFARCFFSPFHSCIRRARPLRKFIQFNIGWSWQNIYFFWKGSLDNYARCHIAGVVIFVDFIVYIFQFLSFYSLYFYNYCFVGTIHLKGLVTERHTRSKALMQFLLSGLIKIQNKYTSYLRKFLPLYQSMNTIRHCLTKKKTN